MAGHAGTVIPVDAAGEGAVTQNASIQRIASNATRGQVTAIHLFMSTFFEALENPAR
jgi:hypothetical protein